ncbi:transglutaminase domain protein [Anaeromyxobacter dehalogenans 2CP-1]|uniref:Transglutaminase domain protein n=1 Tax=Anaeromyxobacter dehalogenans (strain ATCC BAA-258 / DSM 21875 / 2CP-1) TaxID=455488 RepID=B8J5Z7_ANAD2|nr:7TM domain-containing protein [Anaeromyxobacter dehalogenans]ACL66892.1 transglutaminase domain protein [Anaeromyxobacter dehalogenans 2CP-1]
MALPHPHRLGLTVLALVLGTAGLMAYKVRALGYRLADILPVRQYEVTYALELDGHGGDVRVRSFLPSSDAHQTISEERDQTSGLHLSQSMEGPNRVATWSGADVPNGARIRHAFKVLPRRVSYDLPAGLEVPAAYPPSAAAWLRPEKDIQVDAPEIRATLQRIGADQGGVVERLRRIHALAASLQPRPFKGTTDALTALRLGESSCNGKSRLFVALARAGGIPARLVGGLILEPGAKRTSHQWVEAWVAGHWVPFCPTNGHFAELPERYLTLYVGDEALFRHTADVNFDYRFETHGALVPSPQAKATFTLFDVWGLFDRLRLPFALLRTVLMLPVGALLVVLFRNVVGMPTFGTFLPALLAASAGETGAGYGVLAVLLVVAAVAAVRWGLTRLELLHSPTLAILLAAVVLTLLTTSMIAERAGIAQLTRVTMFPIAVLAICAERFYLSLTEHGARAAGKELAGTLVVMLACHAVMSSLALQVLVIGFPEVLLLVVAANVYLGRWVGMRLSEYRRFRGLLGGAA